MALPRRHACFPLYKLKLFFKLPKKDRPCKATPKTMKSSTLRGFVPLTFSLLFLLLQIASPARAEDVTAIAQQAHYLLKQAADPTDTDRAAHLKSAMELMQNLPAGHYHHARIDAIRSIREAILELKQGDPNQKVDGYIRDADSFVRDIEG
jgi:hypothetical protein